jgi:RNA-binding protein Musashi
MADPEDGEDLFADLYVFTLHGRPQFLTLSISYDADESTTRTTSAVEAPKPAAQEDAPPAPAVNTGLDFAPAPVETQESHNAGQPSDYDTGYHNGHGNAYGAPVHAQPPPTEPESQGTGIKEDG